MANRDEFYNRPATTMDWWPENDLLAGRDELAGGTWLSVNKNAEFSTVTNYRDADASKPNGLSRGALPILALTDPNFESQLQQNFEKYNAFNLLVYKSGKLFYSSNVNGFKQEIVPDGIHGLSNASLNTAWPKVTKGKQWLLNELGQKTFSMDRALAFLGDKEIADDHHLPLTGVPLEWERQLSAINIDYKNYGTRVSTVLAVSAESEVVVVELDRANNQQKEYQFKLESSF